MEITFLGTGSAYPTPTRGASCIVLRMDGTYWMFDCGEGSQTQLMRSAIRPGRISKIFISHLHGDHMFGLPGLLCTISQNFSQSEHKAAVQLYGPCGLRKFLRTSLQLSRSQLGFNYVVHELRPITDQFPDDWQTWSVDHEAQDSLHPNEEAGTTIHAEADGKTWNVCEDDKTTVKAAPLKHRIPCFGYVIEEKSQPGRLDVTKLKEMGVPPGPLYSRIKQGETITAANGQMISPGDVLGAPRPGRKIALLGDSCDSSRASSLCAGADIIVHEATLANEMEESALEKGHSTPEMAGRFATSLNAGCLVLTHFSQRFRLRSTALKEGEESTQLLEDQGQRAFPSGKVIAVEDFTVVTVGAKSEMSKGPVITLSSSLGPT